MQVGLLTRHSLPFGKGITDSNSQPFRLEAIQYLYSTHTDQSEGHIGVLRGIECNLYLVMLKPSTE